MAKKDKGVKALEDLLGDAMYQAMSSEFTSAQLTAYSTRMSSEFTSAQLTAYSTLVAITENDDLFAAFLLATDELHEEARTGKAPIDPKELRAMMLAHRFVLQLAYDDDI